MVRTASETTGRTQEAESQSNEDALHLECEFSRALLNWKAQPIQVALDYVNANGRRVVTRVTPDAFVKFNDGTVAFIEMAADEEASKESGEGNPRFMLDPESQRYTDVPLRCSCERLGIGVLLVTTRDVSATLVANLLFFGKGFRTQWKMTEGGRQFITHLQQVGVTRYRDAVHEAVAWKADDVIGCIVNGYVYVDLLIEELVPYGMGRIFASKELAEAAYSAPPEAPALSANEGGGEKFDLSGLTTASELEMYRRYSVIRTALWSPCVASSLSDTEREYLRLYHEAASDFGAGLLGLCPDFADRGFHGSHLHEGTEKLLAEHLEAKAEKRTSETPWTFGKLVLECEDAGVPSPSRVTYNKRWKKRKARPDAIVANEGSGAAYQQSPGVAFSAGTVSRIVSRAFGVGVFDHTPIPIRCLTSFTGVPLRGLSPTLSLLRDEATLENLASVLSFEKVSNRTVMSLLWDCYRRHGALPDRMKLDGESSHDAVTVEQALAAMTSDKVGRRYGKPRDGQVIEGGFSWLMRALFAHLGGNYVNFQDPTEWPDQWDPADLADRTIASLLMVIETFLYDYANTKLRRTTLAGQTSEEARRTSERIHGDRYFRVHPDLNQAKHILLPYCPTEQLVFERQTGFRCLGEPYVPIEAIDPAFYASKHSVKYDPFDVSYVLAKLGKSWTELKHRGYTRFSSLRGIELSAVTLELRSAHVIYAKDDKERAREHATVFQKISEISKDPLADFLKSLGSTPEAKPVEEKPSAWGCVDVNQIPASGSREVDRP
jgi:hypothetical protein